MTSILTLCMVSGLISAADGNAFRGSGLTVTMGQRRAADLRAAMLEELAVALGSGNRVTEQRLGRIEDAMNHIFRAMPKNAHGNLDHSGVRYVLHRLFVDRHRMFVKGLEPGRKAWNSSSPTEVLEDRVPDYVQNLFEERLNGRGLGMHEVAILAATLEHLIHDEAQERLKAAYEVHAVSVATRLTAKEVEAIVDTYMVMFLMGKSVANLTQQEIRRDEVSILELSPAWPESQKFTRDMQRSVTVAAGSSPEFSNNLLSFNATLQVVEEIGDRYGSWQDRECRDLKAALLKLEDPGTGRVPLKQFYSGAQGGQWQFTESVAYLQDP